MSQGTKKQLWRLRLLIRQTFVSVSPNFPEMGLFVGIWNWDQFLKRLANGFYECSQVTCEGSASAFWVSQKKVASGFGESKSAKALDPSQVFTRKNRSCSQIQCLRNWPWTPAHVVKYSLLCTKFGPKRVATKIPQEIILSLSFTTQLDAQTFIICKWQMAETEKVFLFRLRPEWSSRRTWWIPPVKTIKRTRRTTPQNHHQNRYG